MSSPDHPAGGVFSRVWTDTEIVADNLRGDDLGDVLRQDRHASAWWVVSRSDTEALHDLAEVFDLDQVAVQDVMSDDQRIVYHELDDVTVLTTRTAHLGGSETQPSLEVHNVALLVSDRVLIVVADDRTSADLAGALTGPHPRPHHVGPVQATQLVLHHVVSGHAEVVRAIEERADQLAETMFDEQVLSREGKQQIFRLRRAVSELRRVTEPMREQLQSMADADADGKSKRDRSRYWTLVLGHQDRVADSVDALADSLGTLFDTSLSLDDERMNVTMKKLTGWAAIVAAPTLVSGFVGMNVPFWLNGTRAGFYVYLAIMVVAVVVLYIVMKRKNWI